MSVATRANGPVSPALDLFRSGATQPARHRPRIRAVLGEHHVLYRTGLELALRETGIEVVSVANDAHDLARKTRAYHPDVAVLDIDIPPSLSDHDRVEVARNIRSIDPRLAILILSERPNERYAVAVMGDEPAGFGFVVKARVREIEDFTTSVREVARGGTAIDPVLVSRLAARRPTGAWIDDLTNRERRVLALMAEGRSNASIADDLVVTISAVERHITSIFAKLGLRSSAGDHRRVLAVLRYLAADGTCEPRRPQRRNELADEALRKAAQGDAAPLVPVRSSQTPQRNCSITTRSSRSDRCRAASTTATG
jgi:DNA-binding NarL/FixJ family response regulator